jgi:hypothetical protein
MPSLWDETIEAHHDAVTRAIFAAAGRIVARAGVAGLSMAALAAHDPARPILFAGHGAVGTLLKCALAGRPIARAEDQRRIGDAGGGNVLAIRQSDRALLGDWTPMEQLPESLRLS